jgi:hypothetical protein
MESLCLRRAIMHVKEARRALDIKSLPFSRSLPVIRLEAEDYTDSTGEPSLRILVVLDESVDEEKVNGEEVGDLKSAIRENLRRHGVTVFPYIFFAKPSELAATGED